MGFPGREEPVIRKMVTIRRYGDPGEGGKEYFEGACDFLMMANCLQKVVMEHLFLPSVDE